MQTPDWNVDRFGCFQLGALPNAEAKLLGLLLVGTDRFGCLTMRILASDTQ